MNKRQKQIISLLTLLIMLIAADKLLSYALEPMSRADYFRHDMSQLKKNGEKVDMIIIGNSRSVYGFDPLIFHYGEDDDYLNRARYHGIKVGISLDSRVVHDHQSGEYKAWSSELARKSAVDDLELLLDLNVPFNYHSLRMTWMRRYLKGLFKGNANERELAVYKMKYLRKMRHSIENSRKTNMIKQPNWIQ